MGYFGSFKNRTQNQAKVHNKLSEDAEEKERGKLRRDERRDTDRLAGKETEVFSVDTELNLDEIKSNMATATGKGKTKRNA